MPTIICHCERKKELPIVINYNAKEQDGVRTIEITCPYCEDLLSVELPGNIDQTDQVFRGIKKTS